MSAEQRLVDSLAERLYDAHQRWRADLSEAATTWPRWFALHLDLKRPYRDGARAMIDGENRKVSSA